MSNELINRVILYGAGGFLSDREEELFSLHHTAIVGISDSDEDKLGKFIRGVEIRSISDYPEDAYDYIVITSNYAYSISNKLIQMGISSGKVLRYCEYKQKSKVGSLIYYPSFKSNDSEKSIIAVSVKLSFNGAGMALLYLLSILNKKGYKTAMVSEDGDRSFLEYANTMGVDAWICSNILYGGFKDIESIQSYDIVMANDFVVHRFVRSLQKSTPIVWWLHEAEVVYEEEVNLWGDNMDYLWDKVDVYCVSDKGKGAFHKFFPTVETRILEYGIPDSFTEYGRKKTDNKLIFCLIGFVGYIKGQDILLSAVETLGSDNSDCEFWLYGNMREKEYYKGIVERVSHLENVKLYDEVSHDQLEGVFDRIDVLISASRSDQLPMVITEAMMRKKMCIIPDCIGTNKYIIPERDVMIYETGNARQLADCIKKVINNREIVEEYGENGRKVYERYFSMEAFGDRIAKAFKDTYGIDL